MQLASSCSLLWFGGGFALFYALSWHGELKGSRASMIADNYT
jgi:hypothetical protein